MKYLKAYVPALLSAALLAALTAFSPYALDAARRALALCAGVMIPSLFPFFAVSSLLTAYGVPAALGRWLGGPMSRLFRVSGAGAAAFIVGVTGGYPLGAATAAELVRRGELSAGEGTRLICFCNNSGPAFIIGAAGAGVFGSPAWGLLLYAAHVLSALTAGVLLRGGGVGPPSPPAPAPPPPELGAALTDAVRRSAEAVISVCGFVVLFMALTGVLDGSGLLPRLTGELALRSGLGLAFCRAGLTGLLELGGGIGAMAGLPPTAANLALCAFLLGWGGLSVQLQTAAVVSGTGIKTARHTAGRLLIGSLSALYVLAAVLIIRLRQS